MLGGCATDIANDFPPPPGYVFTEDGEIRRMTQYEQMVAEMAQRLEEGADVSALDLAEQEGGEPMTAEQAERARREAEKAAREAERAERRRQKKAEKEARRRQKEAEKEARRREKEAQAEADRQQKEAERQQREAERLAEQKARQAQENAEETEAEENNERGATRELPELAASPKPEPEPVSRPQPEPQAQPEPMPEPPAQSLPRYTRSDLFDPQKNVRAYLGTTDEALLERFGKPDLTYPYETAGAFYSMWPHPSTPPELPKFARTLKMEYERGAVKVSFYLLRQDSGQWKVIEVIRDFPPQ